MPVTVSARSLMRQVMDESSKRTCHNNWLLTLVNKKDRTINKEDFLIFYILKKGPDSAYRQYGHIQWCGQLGYTIHGKLDGIPLKELKEIIAEIDILDDKLDIIELIHE